MQISRFAAVVVASAAVACISIGEIPASEPVELSLLDGGLAIELAADARADLATRVVAYFESCHTFEEVTGERPEPEELREIWNKQLRSLHLAVELLAQDAGEARQVLLGFNSGAGAWPVLSRDGGGVLEIYSKCDGLAGLLLACDVRDIVPHSAAPDDCERLRRIADAPPQPRR